MTAALLPSRAVRTAPLLVCYAVSGVVHVASVGLSTLVPFHLVDLGGSRTQVGLVFSVMTIVSMLVRPAVGGWIDRFGARPVVLPGIALLALTSLALHLPRAPHGVILVMIGVGVATAVITMTTSVMTARASDDAHRGEALSLYYLASSLAIAVAPPAALAIYRTTGAPPAFVAVTGIAVVLFVLALHWPASVASGVPDAQAGIRLVSRPALGVSGALVLVTIGYTSTYAFLPLYAVSRGQGDVVAWFFAVYSGWMIVCRATLGRMSDRFGRGRVVVPAMCANAAAYLVLAAPPTPGSLMIAAVLLGTGTSVLYPTLAALVLDRTPAHERGLALGTLAGAWDLGVVTGSTLIGLVADRVSFGAGFALAGIAALLGTLAFLAAERRTAAMPRAVVAG